MLQKKSYRNNISHFTGLLFLYYIIFISYYSTTKIRRPENQVLSGGKHRTVGVSFLLRSCCHKKTHRDHYDSGKQQES